MLHMHTIFFDAINARADCYWFLHGGCRKSKGPPDTLLDIFEHTHVRSDLVIGSVANFAIVTPLLKRTSREICGPAQKHANDIPPHNTVYCFCTSLLAATANKVPG